MRRLSRRSPNNTKKAVLLHLMGRRRLSPEERHRSGISIIDIAEQGKGVGKIDDLVVFVDKAIPEDVVDVEITRKKKNLAEARITQLVTPSTYRTEPFCPHFGVCGGCKWQHMTYDAQLLFKQQSVESALSRIGKADTSSMEPILPSAQTRFYRNKLEYTFSNKRWLTNPDAEIDEKDMNALGFHVPLRFDKILNIDKCYLQDDPSNAIRNGLRTFALQHGISFYDLRAHSGTLRNLIIRTASTGEVMVIVIFAYPSDEEIQQTMTYLHGEFPQLTSLLYVVNQKKNDTIFDQDIHLFAGRDYIFEEMEGLRFKVGPKTFYQTNSAQAYELYKIAREFAGFAGHERVYDLYTGAGTIANFVARHVSEVIGIEYVPEAIEDAKENAALNGITNATFYAGDMKDILTPEFVSAHGRPDIVITDPPRAGMHADVVNRLLEMGPPKIVYVSCNASTQARDMAILAAKYEVARIRPVDMFPQTQHVENVVLLTLKNG